jgi:uncharacterized membrane protein YidH (DUF202 family)
VTAPNPSGAQRERTALAWRRTALAVAVNGVLLVHCPNSWIEISGFVVLALAAAIAAGASLAMSKPQTSGWIGTSHSRAALCVAVAIAVAVLDLLAIAYA